MAAPSMRDGVDGKPREGGARLGTIGRDHLGQVGHQFGRDYQLRHNGSGGRWGSLRSVTAKTRRRHDPTRSMRTSVSQNESGGGKGFIGFDFPRGKHRAFDGHDCTADPAAVDRNW
jgi:hypothetical protein